MIMSQYIDWLIDRFVRDQRCIDNDTVIFVVPFDVGFEVVVHRILMTVQLSPRNMLFSTSCDDVRVMTFV